MIDLKVCTRCVMDESDKNIYFNEKGICNHCIDAENLLQKLWFPNQIGEEKLKKLLHQIKDAGIGRRYDCIMGLSGGVDSSYLLHLAAKVWNLRVLAVHLNDGWNSETAESYIERLVNELNVVLPMNKIWVEEEKMYLYE
jgi:3'-phosphoadenosine 5'-phosphosulfate sulfotransferase (PAPS reductase)/FAD synthetase